EGTFFGVRHLFFRHRVEQAQVRIHNLPHTFFATFHDLPPEDEPRINFFNPAPAPYRLNAIVPRDVPNSFAISASLYLWTYLRIRMCAELGFSFATASY